ncbi:hypothetical protein EV192_106673 [Actinocrispum wychmicini]|uniref:Uncharacterized protein n=2 Tax=Actinocrispum wychmicini TaxID=1213861 RepID=A0A4R2JJK4_9PSEU|nr:hypothetical protein EV192_106673 [Actinocrispum wychmicini]
MSPQNLLRIRNGEISITEVAAEGLDAAFGWTSGEGIENLLQDREPVDQPARIEIDPLRDESERTIWDTGKEGGLPEHRIWFRIDQLRAVRANRAAGAAQAERQSRDLA